MWTPGLPYNMQPQEPDPPPGVPQQGAWQVTGFAGGIGWGELVMVGTVTSLSRSPIIPTPCPFLSPEKTSFLKFPKEQTRTSLSPALKPLGTSLMPSCQEAKQTSWRPYPQAQWEGGGTAKGPQNGPFPRSGAQFPRL